jgi:hypothetical protein
MADQPYKDYTRAQLEAEAERMSETIDHVWSRSVEACKGTGLSPANVHVVPEIIEVLADRQAQIEETSLFRERVFAVIAKLLPFLIGHEMYLEETFPHGMALQMTRELYAELEALEKD